MNEEYNREKSEKEKARIAAKLAEGAKIVDPLVIVKFQNIEDPPSPGRPSPPFEFSYQVPSGQILSFRVSRAEEKPDTALRHGETYKLPLSVVNHINNLQVPIYAQKQIPDPLTGAVKIVTYIAGYRNRFSCVPTDMSQFQVVDEGKKESKKSQKTSKNDEAVKTNSELANLSNA